MSTRNRVGFFSRLKIGWTLTKDSFGVIRDHPELMIFPILAGISSTFFFIALFAPMLIADLIGGGLEYIVLFLVYFTTTFASTYFTAALVHATNEAFHGRDPSVVDSIKAMQDRVVQIAMWSAAAATVSLILRALENSDNPIASILRSIFAIGWSIMTFFIVPVIVFQGGSLREMFEESGRTFKDTWGETIGARIGVSLIVFGIGIVAVAVSIVLGFAVGTISPVGGLVTVAVLVFGAILFTVLLNQTVQGIVKTALYLYAAEGHQPEQFDNFDFDTFGGQADSPASPGGRSTMSDD